MEAPIRRLLYEKHLVCPVWIRFVNGMCMVCVRCVYGLCMVYVWSVYGLCTVCVRSVCSRCTVCVRSVYGLYTFCVRSMGPFTVCIRSVYGLCMVCSVKLIYLAALFYTGIETPVKVRCPVPLTRLAEISRVWPVSAVSQRTAGVTACPLLTQIEHNDPLVQLALHTSDDKKSDGGSLSIVKWSNRIIAIYPL